MKSTWLILALAIAIGACIDERPYVPTFTEFVIELVNDHGEDRTPAAYDDFKELPDPDGDTNNTAAYDSLFH